LEQHLKYKADDVRCLICGNQGKTNVGGWIKHKNLKAHLQCASHRQACENETEKQKIRQDDLARQSEAYNADGVADFPSFDPLEPSYMPQMFPVGMDLDETHESRPPIPMSQLLHELGTALVEAQSSPEETRAVLQQEFQRMLEDAYLDTHLNDGLADQFIADDLPKRSDEPEDDEDLCFDAELIEDSEYFPYPNKTVGEVVLTRIKLKV
jgi:hypothetical protein